MMHTLSFCCCSCTEAWKAEALQFVAKTSLALHSDLLEDPELPFHCGSVSSPNHAFVCRDVQSVSAAVHSLQLSNICTEH